jgi:hypothetical protein
MKGRRQIRKKTGGGGKYDALMGGKDGMLMQVYVGVLIPILMAGVREQENRHLIYIAL